MFEAFADMSQKINNKLTEVNSTIVATAFKKYVLQKKAEECTCCRFFKNQNLFFLLQEQLLTVLRALRRLDNIYYLRSKYKDVAKFVKLPDRDALEHDKHQLRQAIRELLPCKKCRLEHNPFNARRHAYVTYKSLESLLDE